MFIPTTHPDGGFEKRWFAQLTPWGRPDTMVKDEDEVPMRFGEWCVLQVELDKLDAAFNRRELLLDVAERRDGRIALMQRRPV